MTGTAATIVTTAAAALVRAAAAATAGTAPAPAAVTGTERARGCRVRPDGCAFSLGQAVSGPSTRSCELD